MTFRVVIYSPFFRTNAVVELRFIFCKNKSDYFIGKTLGTQKGKVALWSPPEYIKFSSEFPSEYAGEVFQL